MTTYSVAVVGTGPRPDADSHEGYSMGYRHARSYRAVAGCELRGCADVAPGRAEAFADEFGLEAGRAYADHERLLEEVEPDIVSVCTPPASHPDIVADCARHDAVRAIHCEKPMAVAFGDSRRMVERCEEAGVQLTVNLQNRCSDAAARVRELVADGEIGRLERVELARHDLLQTGLHHVDLANFLLGDEPVEWVLGQIDYPEEHLWYTDMHAEAQGLGMWRYESGVHGLCSTGEGMDAIDKSTNRLVGTDGEIELNLASYECRLRTHDSSGWEPVAFDEQTPQDDAIREVVTSLDDGDDPLIDGRVALAATEIVYGIWESSRRRGRVTLPLEIEDNPLETLVAAGELPPDA